MISATTDRLLTEDRYDILIDEFINKELKLKTGKKILIELSVVNILKVFENPKKFEKYIFIDRSDTDGFYARLNMFLVYLNGKMGDRFLIDRRESLTQILQTTLAYDPANVNTMLDQHPVFPLLFDIVNRYIHVNQY